MMLRPVAPREVAADAFARKALRLAPWLVLAFILLTFRQHGVSNDELVQHRYGELIWSYYLSGFQDRAVFSYINLYLYGGLFDMIAAPLAKLLPQGAVWDLRHLLSALFGLAGMIAAGRIATERAGVLAGLFAWVVLGLTGMWSGAMFTHTKDIPFATCMAWALYFLMRILRAAEEGEGVPGWRDALLFGACTGLALGLRVGAVLIGFYALAGIALMLAGRLRAGHSITGWTGALALRMGAAALLALVLMAVLWPWSVQGWGHVPQALSQFSHFSFDLKTRCAGVDYSMGALPNLYLPLYIAVKLPELALAGLMLWAGFAAWRRPRAIDAAGLALVLAAFFPVAYALISDPPLYNGMRHFLFVTPPLAVLAALGLAQGWKWAGEGARPARWRGPVLAGLLALGAVPLALMHPYGHAGYNAFVGWLPGAARGWETDYWSSAIKPLAEQLAGLPQVAHAAPGSIPLALCAEGFQIAHLLPPAFRITKAWPEAEYFLSTTHMGCDGALDGRVIASIQRMGVPLAVLKERRAEGQAWQKAHPEAGN